MLLVVDDIWWRWRLHLTVQMVVSGKQQARRKEVLPLPVWAGLSIWGCFGHIQLGGEKTPRRTKNLLEGLRPPPIPGRTWRPVSGAEGGSWFVQKLDDPKKIMGRGTVETRLANKSIIIFMLFKQNQYDPRCPVVVTPSGCSVTHQLLSQETRDR